MKKIFTVVIDNGEEYEDHDGFPISYHSKKKEIEDKRAAKKHNSFSYAFLGASVIGVVLSLLSLETSFLFIIPALVCLAGVLSWEYANGEFGNYQSKKGECEMKNYVLMSSGHYKFLVALAFVGAFKIATRINRVIVIAIEKSKKAEEENND